MFSKNSQNEPFYISLDVVLEIHRRQLKAFGGADGIRNQSGLEAAIESPNDCSLKLNTHHMPAPKFNY
ncbi:MAG: hypothetical protein AABY64_01205 [Bdellovibrionota bacterium]